jgi:molybdate transport system substrate-binding protein
MAATESLGRNHAMLLPRRALLAAIVTLPLLAGAAVAAEIKVMSSGGFHAALDLLAPEFEKATGHTVTKIYGASMGAVPTAVPNRLARGEAADMVIIAGEAIDKLIAEGKLKPGSRTDLVFSRIGVMVKAGAPQPDISTPASVKAMLLAAPSVAYSDSASGVYISSRFFQGLGITEQMAGKSFKVPSTKRVAQVVAAGEAAVGFQQISEILGQPGITLVGPLPEAIQLVTSFSAGIPVSAEQPEVAKAFVAFLTAPAAWPTIRSMGLDPAGEGKR